MKEVIQGDLGTGPDWGEGGMFLQLAKRTSNLFYWVWLIVMVRKWAKIERNDGKRLRAKISTVVWRVYLWNQWVSETIVQNRLDFSYIFFLMSSGMTAYSTDFSLSFQSSLIGVDKRRKLKRKSLLTRVWTFLFSASSLLTIGALWLFSLNYITITFLAIYCKLIKLMTKK